MHQTSKQNCIPSQLTIKDQFSLEDDNNALSEEETRDSNAITQEEATGKRKVYKSPNGSKTKQVVLSNLTYKRRKKEKTAKVLIKEHGETAIENKTGYQTAMRLSGLCRKGATYSMCT
eukprot:41218-Ditylum_brightwellii.AAC.1